MRLANETEYGLAGARQRRLFSACACLCALHRAGKGDTARGSRDRACLLRCGMSPALTLALPFALLIRPCAVAVLRGRRRRHLGRRGALPARCRRARVRHRVGQLLAALLLPGARPRPRASSHRRVLSFASGGGISGRQMITSQTAFLRARLRTRARAAGPSHSRRRAARRSCPPAHPRFRRPGSGWVAAAGLLRPPRRRHALRVCVLCASRRRRGAASRTAALAGSWASGAWRTSCPSSRCGHGRGSVAGGP